MHSPSGEDCSTKKQWQCFNAQKRRLKGRTNKQDGGIRKQEKEKEIKIIRLRIKFSTGITLIN
jgi:hypothetical protein